VPCDFVSGTGMIELRINARGLAVPFIGCCVIGGI